MLVARTDEVEEDHDADDRFEEGLSDHAVQARDATPAHTHTHTHAHAHTHTRKTILVDGVMLNAAYLSRGIPYSKVFYTHNSAA